MTNRQGWLLVAVAHRRGQPLTPVQIQKIMFLMKQEASAFVGDNFYNFIPYNYGPFDSDIYGDLDQFASQGLVTKDGYFGRTWHSYAITPLGMEAAASARQNMSDVGLGYLEKVVDWVCGLPFPELLRSIYTKYPEYRANSVFAG